MSGKKRKSTSSLVSPPKKSKTDNEAYFPFLDHLTSNQTREDQVEWAIDYFHAKFNPNSELNTALPPIITTAQIYAMCSISKTSIDRRLEEMRHEKELVMFKSDDEDVYICRYDEFKRYVNEKRNEQNGSVLDTYFRIIDDIEETSVEKSKLMITYKLTEKDLTCLIQLGLLTIRNVNSFWFAVPNIGQFRRLLVESRNAFMSIVRKQKYNEINVRHFFDKLVIGKNKTYKRAVAHLGAESIIAYQLGKQVVRKVDSPQGVFLKLSDD